MIQGRMNDHLRGVADAAAFCHPCGCLGYTSGGSGDDLRRHLRQTVNRRRLLWAADCHCCGDDLCRECRLYVRQKSLLFCPFHFDVDVHLDLATSGHPCRHSLSDLFGRHLGRLHRLRPKVKLPEVFWLFDSKQ